MFVPQILASAIEHLLPVGSGTREDIAVHLPALKAAEVTVRGRHAVKSL
jgi:hypothetical protein